ncbi:TPA: fimbrial protein [Pseudomonas aeruginosa]|uniref:fimbrial protein n=1 Tax=Pseudomonas aeruginosa TaxID=287 RepID=UPI0018C65925|nr:fimbrial protein [Pseudomonas aeruginosa]QYE77349.1 fimbrial protein [Pseudomonas aeruginosa]HBO2186300.1 fimbrial protein [Pseudomonas aeruginosa]HBO3292967.1 fimbrial protein [Pseudomonas aeruginosa]HCL3993790.1 fimbrial protein [Pseudomonas aeruginosa]
MLTPFWVFAACKAETSDGKDYFVVTVTGFNPPPFSPGDYSIGGIIYEATAAGLMFTNKRSDKPQTECDTPTNIFVTGIGSPGGNNVYPTSVPNIGLRITNSSGKPFPYDDGGPWRSMSWSQSYAPRIQLIKTGNITAPGILAGAYARYTANNASGQTLVEYRFASPLVITPRVPTCKVDTPKILVSMRQKLASAMSFPGVGGIGPEENFEIRLSCSGGDAGTSTRPFVTLSDASTPGNRSTTLSLSAESSARGVGIQILKDNVPLGYGPDSNEPGTINQWSAGTVKQGQVSHVIPLQARYIQTAERITSGSVKASATFTLSYQ